MPDPLINNATLPEGATDRPLAGRCERDREFAFVLLQAHDTIEAIRLQANRLKVWRKA